MPLADGRRVTVYLPGRLRSGRRRYPVLLLSDGQNLFEPDRAFVAGQHWRVGETADALIARRRIPPMIICGIDHAGPERIREMTPTPGPDRTGGDAARYAALIVDDVPRLVRREFPVSHDRDETGLGGSSLGGLVSLFTAIEHPGLRPTDDDVSVRLVDSRVILDRIARHPRGFAGTRSGSISACRKAGQPWRTRAARALLACDCRRSLP